LTNNTPSDVSGESVLYAASEYASLLRRFAILVVDGAVIFLAWCLIAATMPHTIGPYGRLNPKLVLSGLAFGYLYLAISKPSRIRTLGYWITGVRIVDHKGQAPSLVRMTFRVFLWSLGPFNPVIDLLWLSGDRHRQTLRDKIAGTYVIRHEATPISRGHRKATYLSLMGVTLVLWEIEPDA